MSAGRDDPLVLRSVAAGGASRSTLQPARPSPRSGSSFETSALRAPRHEGVLALRREQLGWAWLSVGSLAVAGIFALLLALSRIPGMERTPFWPIDFFYKGLVIHVVFSLVIWLLAIFAFLLTTATLEIGGDALRARALGRLGQGLVLIAFPCLFGPAFLEYTQPELTNYVPLIRHPLYDLGLVLLAAGVLAPVGRLFLNLPGRSARLSPFAFAAAVGGFAYVAALVSFLTATALAARTGDVQFSRDAMIWGGGHGLQFVYAALLMINWRLLAERSLGRDAINESAFRIAVVLVAVIALVGPLFYVIFPAFSEPQHEAFRFLQFFIAIPSLLFGATLLAGMRGRPVGLPWRDPAFFALAASLALFALGGAMGFLIDGRDTRTPAHYHAVITAVSVSGAGMLLTFGLEALRRAPVSPRATRILLGLYAGGQFVASIAMFVAGGYGAARKTPTGELDHVAAAGMAVHGIASIFTILGGAAFVIVAIRALARPATDRARA